jgi:hypothetical protein
MVMVVVAEMVAVVGAVTGVVTVAANEAFGLLLRRDLALCLFGV